MNIWCRLPVSAGGQIPSRGHWPPLLWQEQLPDLFFCSSRFLLNRLLGRFSLLAALSLCVSVNAIAKYPLLVEGCIANIGLWSHNFLFVSVSMIFCAFQLFSFSVSELAYCELERVYSKCPWAHSEWPCVKKNCMGRGQTHTQTHTQTLRLLDQLGPEGRVGENWVVPFGN